MDGGGVTWDTLLHTIDDFVHSSGAWTTHKKMMELGTPLRHARDVLNVHPLAPHPQFLAHRVECHFVPAFKSAIRMPQQLLDAWTFCCVNTGRIAGPGLVGEHVVCSGDGLADKCSIYHLGFHFGSDPNVMSAYAHRDFIVGPLSEKNQFHAMFLGKGVADLRRAVLSRGGLFVHSGDWESMKCMARGLFANPGGFAIKDTNARILPAPLCLPAARTATLVPWPADVAVRLIGLRDQPIPQLKDGVCGTKIAKKPTSFGMSFWMHALSGALWTATRRPGMVIRRVPHPVSACWGRTIATRIPSVDLPKVSNYYCPNVVQLLTTGA